MLHYLYCTHTYIHTTYYLHYVYYVLYGNLYLQLALRQKLVTHRSCFGLCYSFSSGTSASPQAKETMSDSLRKELAEIRSLIGSMAASGSLPLLANGHRAGPNAGAPAALKLLCRSCHLLARCTS